MIYGMGHDLVDNDRIGKLLDRYGQKCINRILSIDEQEVFRQRSNKINFLAKRFAAKEAFAKACGTGIRQPVTLNNISIINDSLGKPIFKFAPQLQIWLSDRNITNCHISITDTKTSSSAFVILEIFTTI